jgi:hypothetical protein
MDKKRKALYSLQGETKTEVARSYISRAWALKFETMTNPGVVDNWSFACEHGGVAAPAIPDAQDRVVTVTNSALSTLETLYGGSNPPHHIISLEPCEICKSNHEKLQQRRDAEYRTIIELDKRHPNLWYVIPKPWINKWIAFVKNDVGPLGRGPFHGVLPPPKIDTECLLEKDGTTVKPNLKLNVHYRCVNHAVFKYWQKTYGFQGPVIPRVADNLYSAVADESAGSKDDDVMTIEQPGDQ